MVVSKNIHIYFDYYWEKHFLPFVDFEKLQNFVLELKKGDVKVEDFFAK